MKVREARFLCHEDGTTSFYVTLEKGAIEESIASFRQDWKVAQESAKPYRRELTDILTMTFVQIQQLFLRASTEIPEKEPPSS